MGDEIRNLTEILDALGVGWKWSGLCVWTDKAAETYAEELASWGFRWSMKRGAWYYRYNGGM